MNRREAAYNDKLEELIGKVGRLEAHEIEKVRALLERLSTELSAGIAKTDWQVHRLNEMKAAVTNAFEVFRIAWAAQQAEALGNAWLSGIDLVESPLHFAGIRLRPAALSRSMLEVLQGYSADLIGGLSTGGIKLVNTKLAMGLMGGKTPFETMKEIGTTLTDQGVVKQIASRAETITRTEFGRVQSAAREARIRAVQAGNTVPPIRLAKKWISSGKAHPRRNHAALNGKVVPIDKKFPGGILFPHAPGLPAGEVVNCGCIHVLTSPDWETLPEDWDAVTCHEQAIYD